MGSQVIVFLAVAGLLFGLNALLQDNLNPYLLRVVINAGIAIILALSLNLVNGCAGQFSLGHAGFMGVGAYVSSILTTILPNEYQFFLFQGYVGVIFSIFIGGMAAALAGYLVGLPSLRLKGDYLAIVTLGFGEIIRITFLNIPIVGGARGLPGIPRTADFFWVYLIAFLTFVILNRLLSSSYGRAVLSVRENEIAAEAMGINVSQYKVFAFVISSFFAGIAGGLFAHYQGFIDPNTFNFNRSVEVVIMVVIGGMGSLSGSILGALVVSILPEALRGFAQYRLIVFPLVLIVLMLLRPRGLMGHLEIWQIPLFSKRNGKKKILLKEIKGV
jgi:branched-chain amino acid transport system permease protein